MIFGISEQKEDRRKASLVSREISGRHPIVVADCESTSVTLPVVVGTFGPSSKAIFRRRFIELSLLRKALKCLTADR
jgi:hypothetical protein